ncbi:MAG: DNA-methyltransferase [Candidatus Neomarinimicrobiota bacterium]
MSESSNKTKAYMYNNPMEAFPGLSIDDLNRYLPAIQTVEDMSTFKEALREGIFLSKCINGLNMLPNDSIDLIIANPPVDNWNFSKGNVGGNTLQEYYQWNQKWLSEVYRILKNTGAIYIITPWQYSGMYQGLLSNLFQVQTRITWKNKVDSNHSNVWKNNVSDIWFATKTNEFLFNQKPIGVNTVINQEMDDIISNLWIDIPSIIDEGGRYPQKLYSRILDASSFKLNWVLDPFMRFGDVGVACKSNGRRFIGLETNKDYLLLAMKRIDNT